MGFRQGNEMRTPGDPEAPSPYQYLSFNVLYKISLENFVFVPFFLKKIYNLLTIR